MSGLATAGQTRVLLSFSSAYAELARRIANDLDAANIAVRYDQWKGGGGVPASQSVAAGIGDATFVLPLLTPSDAAPTWISDEWKRAIYDEAIARGIGLLPLRGDGDLAAIPDFLSERSFADLRAKRYAPEFRRLVESIREHSRDAGIKVPDAHREADAARSAMTRPAEPIVLEIADTLRPHFEGEEGTTFVNEQVPMMYDGLFYELGVRFPRLRVRFGSDVPPSSYRIVLNDVPEAQVEMRAGSVLVNERVGPLARRGFTAEPAVNPANGADCAWIPADQEEAATAGGSTTWDAQGFLILTLSACSGARQPTSSQSTRQRACWSGSGLSSHSSLWRPFRKPFPCSC